MNVFSGTHRGLIRDENQDRVWVSRFSSGAVAAVLCDGMGGENAGSFASETAITLISERLTLGFSPDIDEISLRNLMITALNNANSAIYEISHEEDDKNGMGTTCVAAIAAKDVVYIINVGDSRAYRVFDGGIQQITHDHTFVRRLIDEGKLTRDEARFHPDRNKITRAIGAAPEVTPDFFKLEFKKGSKIILCSDGLSSYVADEEIGKTALSLPSDSICEKLITLANKNGGGDNISVALIEH